MPEEVLAALLEMVKLFGNAGKLLVASALEERIHIGATADHHRLP